MFKLIGSMKSSILIVAIGLCLARNNLVCSSDAESMMGNENVNSGPIEFSLNDLKLNTDQVNLTSLLSNIEESMNETSGPDYAGAQGAFNALLGLENSQATHNCNEQVLSTMGQLAGLLEEAQKNGAPKRTVDGIVRKSLERQTNGPCTYEVIRDIFESKLKAVRYSPTILDRLRKFDTKNFFYGDFPNLEIRSSQWPDIFYELSGHEFPACLMVKKFLPNLSKLSFIETGPSYKKFIKYHATKLKPMCINYAQNGMGLFVRLAPYIKLFLPEQYDFKHDVPKLFKELPKKLDTLDRELLFGWITNETFNDMRRNYFLCDELVALDRKQLEKIFTSLATWRASKEEEEKEFE